MALSTTADCCNACEVGVFATSQVGDTGPDLSMGWVGLGPL